MPTNGHEASAREFPCLDRPATQVEFAALVGVSQPAVAGYVSRGVLRKGDTLRRWLLLWAEHIREQAAGRGAGNGDGQEALLMARIRESEAKAHKAEVETAEKLRELVAVRDLEPALRDWAARGTQAVGAALERIVETIESDFRITLEDRHVREPLHAALRDLAAYPSLAASAVAEDRDTV